MNRRFANVAIVAIALISLASYLPFAPVRLHDFRAFYCAGKALLAHADPYREHPLGDCERNTTAPGVSVDADDVTVPAPLPSYALVPFALLALLPFGYAALLWICASIAALLATIELLRRTIALPVPTIAVAIILPASVVAIPLGQPAPFLSCAIAACAYGVQKSRWGLAAAGALATAIDPPIALALCSALFIAIPPMRLRLVCGTAALGILSLLASGIDINLEYVRSVLHAHAVGNVAERSQFSTTHFAWIAGMDSNAALLVGNVWYGCAVASGVWMAMRLRARYGPAALAVVPPAFAVFGGLYVHYSQLGLAIPAFLLVLSAPALARSWLSIAIFTLAVPWLALVAFPPFAIALVALAIAYSPTLRGENAGLRLGLGSAALLLLFFAGAVATIHPPSSAFHESVSGNALADAGWSRYVAWRDPGPDPFFLLLQLPTVIAFAVCLAGVCSASIPRRSPSPSI